MNYILALLDFVGIWTSFILCILSVWMIQKRSVYFYYYIGGFIFNMVLNAILKSIWKQPRPDSDVSWLKIMETDGRPVDAHMYGMPSGHAQESFFSLAFVYGMTQNKTKHREKKLVWIFAALCALTVCQRVLTRRHTLLQVTVGALLGWGIGYGLYILATHQLKGDENEKPDDDNRIAEGFTY